MTSGRFEYIAVNDITIPPDRQRQEFKEDKLRELADSIARCGLIQPIVVDETLVLVAGERRLRAHIMLGFDQIAVQFTSDLSPDERRLIELEENVKRTDLTWQEQTAALASFHETKLSMEAGWNKTKSSEALGISARQLDAYLLVAEALEEEVPEVLEAPKFTTAHSFASRRQERKKAQDKRKVSEGITEAFTKEAATQTSSTEGDAPTPPPVVAPRKFDIFQGDFNDWVSRPFDHPANLLHCDFPYGINATKVGQSAAKSHGGYDDGEDVYWNLLDVMAKNLDNFVAPSAHMVFWFSMNYYEETRHHLEDMGWRVFLPLLVWGRSDGKGIIADHNRVPRNVTETAFLCSRGDRKIVRSVNNLCWTPTTKEYHMSEKPHAVLAHFFRMLVDDSTILFDPTAGSGMAIRVATELGASYASGVELNPDYVEEALRNLSHVE